MRKALAIMALVAAMFGADVKDHEHHFSERLPCRCLDSLVTGTKTREKQHTGNQYTQWDTKWKAQKTPVEQMEQAGTNGTNKNKKENKNIKEENNIKEEKKKYLEFVLLSDEEYWKLLNIFWKERLDKEIQKLNNYIGSSWKKYKSHYFTIRQWNQEFIQEMEKRKKELNTKNDLSSEEWLLWTITLKR